MNRTSFVASLHVVVVAIGLAAIGLTAFHATAIAAPSKAVPGDARFRASCVGCHSTSCNRQGPKLQDIFGRKAGSVADFGSYTQALKDSGIVWTDETLDALLRDPGKLVPGTSMTTIRISSAKDRKDLIAFMKRQDKSIDLCF